MSCPWLLRAKSMFYSLHLRSTQTPVPTLEGLYSQWCLGTRDSSVFLLTLTLSLLIDPFALTCAPHFPLRLVFLRLSLSLMRQMSGWRGNFFAGGRLCAVHSGNLCQQGCLYKLSRRKIQSQIFRRVEFLHKLCCGNVQSVARGNMLHLRWRQVLHGREHRMHSMHWQQTILYCGWFLCRVLPLRSLQQRPVHIVHSRRLSCWFIPPPRQQQRLWGVCAVRCGIHIDQSFFHAVYYLSWWLRARFQPYLLQHMPAQHRFQRRQLFTLLDQHLQQPRLDVVRAGPVVSGRLLFRRQHQHRLHAL
ncbi:hypothetical protein C8R43DRAFT_1021208 [Mycena crocata]|nr:hypothetical protein C8R43DRAFT_1021208 [Mycena crocata]